MELNLLSLSIGIGLVASLVFSEIFGIAAGGLVVPGYIALFLTRPLDVAATLTAALVTFFLVRLASTFVIVYGRRRTALMILVGYAVGALFTGGLDAVLQSRLDFVFPSTADGLGAGIGLENVSRNALEAGVIGYIVPGLIAIWLDRQGVLPTLSALITSAVVVRMVLILAVPEQLRWYEASMDSRSHTVFEEMGP